MNGYGELIQDGETKCGVLGKWAVRIRSAKNVDLIVVANRNEDRKTLKQVQAQLREKGLQTGCMWTKGRISFFLSREKLGAMPEEEWVGACLGALESAGVEPETKCPFCAGEGCDAAAFAIGDYRPVHSSCLEKRASALEERARDDEFSGSHVSGALGAVIGMFVGTVPSLIAAVLLERVFVLLMALIPLCVYYGYRICHGRMDKTPLVLCLLLSPAGVFALGWETEAARLLRWRPGLGVGRLFDMLGMLMRRPENWTNMLREYSMAFLYVAIGIFIVWSVISRTSRSDAKDAEEMRKFLRPYGDGNRTPLL